MTLHALVIAAPTANKDELDAFILTASPEILDDMKEAFGSRDLNDGGPDVPAEAGIWIWEGSMRLVRGHEGDDDVEYSGMYRRATSNEIAKVVAGEPLWPEDLVRDPDDDREPQDL